jgi:hypothetical protein
MDYSSISNDPAGTSPWASPRPNEATYPPSATSDIPSSPLAPQQQSPYDADADTQPTDPLESRAPAESGEGSPSLAERVQNTHIGEPGYGAEQAGSPTQPRTQLPARYQTGARQNARQPAPVYKIQAKITALERTGKKDPILRFDVHVRSICTSTGSSANSVARPISPNLEPPSIVMLGEHIPSLSNWPTI